MWSVSLGRPGLRAASSTSLLLLAVLTLGGPFGELQQGIPGRGAAEARGRLKAASGRLPDLGERLLAGESVAELRAFVDARAAAERVTPRPKAKADAERIARALGVPRTALDERRNLLGDLIQRLMKLFEREDQERVRPPSLGGATTILNGVVWVLLGAALLAGLMFVGTRVGKLKRKPKKTAEILDEDEATGDAESWLARADEEAAAGRYRAAFRALFVSRLHAWAMAEGREFRRSETNGEFLLALGERREEARPWVERFETIWYGGGPMDGAEYESWRDRDAA